MHDPGILDSRIYNRIANASHYGTERVLYESRLASVPTPCTRYLLSGQHMTAIACIRAMRRIWYPVNLILAAYPLLVNRAFITAWNREGYCYHLTTTPILAERTIRRKEFRDLITVIVTTVSGHDGSEPPGVSVLSGSNISA
jgi:hypothetical protein